MNNNLTIACSKKNLIHIRKFINDSLSQIELRTTHLNLIVLAIDEICSNRIIHSNQCNDAKKLEINCNYTSTKNTLNIIIKDQGNIFEYEKYTEPSLENIIKEKGKGGIGLLLVRKIMDEINYTSDKNYNITTLTKKINPQSLAY